MKIKNKSELRKQMREFSGYYYVIYIDGSWESAHQFDDKEKYEELKNFEGVYAYKGYSVTSLKYSDNEYYINFFSLSVNDLISQAFAAIENGHFTKEAIEYRKRRYEKGLEEIEAKKNMVRNIKQNAEKRLEELKVLKNKLTNVKDKELIENVINEYRFLVEEFNK